LIENDEAGLVPVQFALKSHQIVKNLEAGNAGVQHLELPRSVFGIEHLLQSRGPRARIRRGVGVEGGRTADSDDPKHRIGRGLGDFSSTAKPLSTDVHPPVIV
jgi:hypothetical protein